MIRHILSTLNVVLRYLELTQGANIWGTSVNKDIDAVHSDLCKCVLGVD